jgi:epoxyqueuosine reductase
MKEEIINIVLSVGADVCGFANVNRFVDFEKGFSPVDIYNDCKSVLVFGLALPHGLSKISPRLIYEHYNELSCPTVDSIAFQVAKIIKRKYECFAVPIPCDDPVGAWDDETKTAHGLLSMKHAAVMAGIGFMGKNTLLTNEQFGNQLTIGAVLLSLDLPSDDLCPNLCIPTCHKCIDNCPVHAINNDGTVTQKLCRENTYLKTFRGISTVECNKCRMGCPLAFGVRKKNNHYLRHSL